MAHSEFKNAPPVFGWAIAVAAGALMFGVSLVVIGIGGNGSVAIGAVVALIIGLIFTIAERAPEPAASPRPSDVPTATAPSVPTTASAAASVAPEPAAAKPAPAPVQENKTNAQVEPVQPEGLDAPVGEKDDLKRISGVGPVLEGKLNGLGFYHFWQIARWTRAEVDWVDGYLSFKGRIDRDDWISQATKLAADSPSKPPA